MLQLLCLVPRGAARLHAVALCWLPLAAQTGALLVMCCGRLVVHGAVAVGVIVGHAVIVGGGVRHYAHEEGHEGGVVNEGKQEGGVDGEVRDGARGRYYGGGGRLHAFLAELDGAGVADAGHSQWVVRYSRKIRSRKQRAKA